MMCAHSPGNLGSPSSGMGKFLRILPLEPESGLVKMHGYSNYKYSTLFLGFLSKDLGFKSPKGSLILKILMFPILKRNMKVKKFISSKPYQ